MAAQYYFPSNNLRVPWFNKDALCCNDFTSAKKSIRSSEREKSCRPAVIIKINGGQIAFRMNLVGFLHKPAFPNTYVDRQILECNWLFLRKLWYAQFYNPSELKSKYSG